MGLKKRYASLDHLIVAMGALQEKKMRKASKALVKAMEEDDMEEAMEDLEESQEYMDDDDMEEEMSALKSLAKKLSKAAGTNDYTADPALASVAWKLESALGGGRRSRSSKRDAGLSKLGWQLDRLSR